MTQGPKIFNLTAESHPDIGALLQPPETYYVIQTYPRPRGPQYLNIIETYDNEGDAWQRKELENLAHDYSSFNYFRKEGEVFVDRDGDPLEFESEEDDTDEDDEDDNPFFWDEFEEEYE